MVPEGQDRSKYGFYEPLKSTSDLIVNVQETLRCIDEPFEISGSYDTFTAQNLMVVYEVCNPESRKCKSQETIERILKTTYMLIIENN